MNIQERIQATLLGLVIALTIFMLVAWFMLAPVAMIDVEVYRMEDGSYIYCATGSLTDPPATHISSGAVPAGDESYC